MFTVYTQPGANPCTPDIIRNRSNKSPLTTLPRSRVSGIKHALGSQLPAIGSQELLNAASTGLFSADVDDAAL